MSVHGRTAFIPTEVREYWAEREREAALALPTLSIVFTYERRPRVYVHARDEEEFRRLRDWIESHDVERLVERVPDWAERERRWRP